MKQQFAVIGLGNFGFYAAKALFEDGNEVLAIDIDKARVQAIAPHATEAMVFDATDTEFIAIKELVPQNFVLVPPASFVIKENDILIMLGKSADIRRIKALK